MTTAPDPEAASARVTIQNELGLHLRPASVFAAAAASHGGTVVVRRTDTQQTADGCSPLSLLQLCLTQGAEIEIEVTGESAPHTLTVLVDLINRPTEA